MGNRAVITSKKDLSGVGVYLHWNGGKDSIQAFLKYCEMKGYRSPEQDESYAYSRLTQVIANFFGGSCSVGVNTCAKLDCDNYDNGVYIIKGWKIVDRLYHDGPEQEEYDLMEMMLAIDEKQPKDEQISDILTADIIPTNEVKIGDIIAYIDSLDGKVYKNKIIGLGADRIVNGHKVLGVPYIDRYGSKKPEDNPNNYIFTENVFKVKNIVNDKVKDVEVLINKQLNGIELKFNKKPLEMTREELKKHGFRWHSKKQLWYAKKTIDNTDFVTALTGVIVE